MSSLCSFISYSDSDGLFLPESLRVVPLTDAYQGAFYSLIQEQAEQHHSSSSQRSPQEIHALYESVAVKNDCEGFLVVDADAGRALSAVTFYDCYKPCEGGGLYLEDIVTTKTARRHGIGSVAMKVLLSKVLEREKNYLAWECAVDNDAAHKFYAKFGAEPQNAEHTLRRLETGNLSGLSSSPFIYRQAEPRDCLAILSLMKESEPTHEIDRWLSHDSITAIKEAPTPMLVVAENEGAGTIEGVALAYRSFSTFRIVCGIHVSCLWARNNRDAIATGFLHFFEKTQKDPATPWRGHLDITLSSESRPWLEPLLTNHRFEPLAYGGDEMTPYILRRPTIHDILRPRAEARRHGLA